MRLRDKPRDRTVVVVRVVNPVRVELDLAVVEVEVRSVRKVVISARIFATHPSEPPGLEIYFPLEVEPYSLNLELYLAAVCKKQTPALDEGKQSPQNNTLLKTVVVKTLVEKSL